MGKTVAFPARTTPALTVRQAVEDFMARDWSPTPAGPPIAPGGHGGPAG